MLMHGERYTEHMRKKSEEWMYSAIPEKGNPYMQVNFFWKLMIYPKKFTLLQHSV